jgi:hypothetical protein
VTAARETEIELEDIAREAAAARGDAKAVKTAILGTELQPGFATRLEVLTERLAGADVAHQDFRLRIEKWLEHIDVRIGDLSAAVVAALKSRPHPSVVALIVLCMVMLALSSLVIAGGVGYGVINVMQDRAVERSDR